MLLPGTGVLDYFRIESALTGYNRSPGATPERGHQFVAPAKGQRCPMDREDCARCKPAATAAGTLRIGVGALPDRSTDRTSAPMVLTRR